VVLPLLDVLVAFAFAEWPETLTTLTCTFLA